MKALVAQALKLPKTQIFRYGLAAIAATLTDMVVFVALNTYVFQFDKFPVAGIHITRETLALIASYSTGVILNFLISKFYVFTESTLRGRVQFIRFLLGAALVFVGNYFMLKFMIWCLPQLLDFTSLPYGKLMQSVLERGISAVVVASASFTFHKLYTFR